MVKLLEDHDLTEQADSLADYLPNGPIFEGKKICDTNLRLLLEGLAGTLERAEADINQVSDQYDFRKTSDFIEEWEGFVGIPDECLDTSGTLQERRNKVEFKLVSSGAQTAEDFEAIAVLLFPGLQVRVLPGNDPNAGISGTLIEKRFTMVVQLVATNSPKFTLEFESPNGIPFGTQEAAVLECLFLELRPANVHIIFQEFPTELPELV